MRTMASTACCSFSPPPFRHPEVLGRRPSLERRRPPDRPWPIWAFRHFEIGNCRFRSRSGRHPSRRAARAPQDDGKQASALLLSSLRGAERRSNPAGLPAIASRPGLLRSARNDELHYSRAALFLAPRALPHVFTNGPPQKGGGAPKGAYRGRAGAQAERRLYCAHRGARRFWRTRSPLGALPRFSPRLLPLGSVRSRASWDRDACASVTPGSQLLADPPIPIRLGGGPGEFPNRPRRSYEPHPGHRSRSRQTAVTG